MSKFFIQVVLSLLLVYNVPGAKVEQSTICHLGNNIVTYNITNTDHKQNNFYIEGISEYDTLEILTEQPNQVSVVDDNVFWHSGNVLIIIGKTVGNCTNEVPNVISNGRIYFPFYVNEY